MMVVRGWLGAAVLFSVVALGACQSTSRLAGPSQDFIAAANALAQAEADYFDEIQAASNASHQLFGAESYVGHNGKFVAVAAELTKRDDFSKAKQLRVAVMSQLQNYAQQIAAIANGASATWVADDAKAATTSVTGLLADLGGAKVSAAEAGIIQKAVTALGQAVIDSASAKEIQTLAEQAREPIAKIAEMVKQDDENIEKDRFAPGLVLDQTQALMNILHVIYDDPNVTAAERFGAIQIQTNWRPALVTKGHAIQAALAKLQAANDALAAKQHLSAAALAEQAFGFAKAALAAPAK